MPEGPLPEHNCPHGIGGVVTALVGVGLRTVWLREYPGTPDPLPGFLVKRPEGDFGGRAGAKTFP